LKEVSIKTVLKQIESQTDFLFLFNSKLVDVEQKISLFVENKSINEVLVKLFQNTEITYKIVDKQIVLTAISNQKTSTSKKITGLVTDEKGDPIIGASIVVKGSTIGTVSDVDGKFSVEVPSPAILKFSYIGYVNKEIEVTNKSAINVQLTENSKNLDEVVVVGYGTQRKGTLTSSVSVVKADEINKSAVNDVSNTLGGKAAGVIIRNFNAEPGNDKTNIYVRGISTSGNSNPLIVIDGIPDRDISMVDVNDIESVTVLKDASAVAPYGSRGANGVILITTKRGKLGKPTIDYKTYYGVQQATFLPKYASSGDYATYYNEALRNTNQNEQFTADEISKFYAGNSPEYPNTDWLKELLAKNPIQSYHNLSVSGATDKITYLLSLGTYEQQGLFGNYGYNRYNVRANIDANVTKDLKVSLDLVGRTGDMSSPVNAANNTQSGTSYFMGNVARMFNIDPVRNSLGQYVAGTVGNAVNSVATIELGGYNRTNTNNFLGNLTFQYTPSYIPGLTIKLLGAYDKGYNYRKEWSTFFPQYRLIDRANATYEIVPPATQPRLKERTDFSNLQQLEFQINYKKTIAEQHNIGALFVANQTQWGSNFTQGQRINFPSYVIDQMFAGPQAGQSVDGSAYQGARIGYVGRLTYDYMGKYMFETNARYDGSMNFPKGKRWGFFPSFALAWRISEEPFIKDNFKSINNLKLRGSWGKAGNDRIADYQYLATYTFQAWPYSFGDAFVQAASESRVANTLITWETANLFDVGFELNMWSNKLTLEADYFHKRTEGILLKSQKITDITGIFYSFIPDENIGIVENQGFEVILGHRNQVGDFKYYANTTFTYAKNKAIEIGESDGLKNDPIRRQTGRALNQYMGKIALGLFTSAEEVASSPKQGNNINPGDIKYKDINGPAGVPDGVIDNFDNTNIGFSNIPEIIYGLNFGAEYKGFDFTVNFQGATNVSYYFIDAGNAAFDGAQLQTWQVENRWTVENNNPNARYPRLTPSSPANNNLTSSYWLRDGTYLRLKTAQLGYNFNKSLLNKFKIQALRLYVSGQNLFTWVKDPLMYLDPEATQSKGEFYPQSKVYLMGLNITF